MDTNAHSHKGKGIAGWIIAIVLLIAILLLVTLIPRSAAGPQTANKPQMTQEESATGSTMQQSDDPQAIQSDIDSQLQTDFQF